MGRSVVVDGESRFVTLRQRSNRMKRNSKSLVSTRSYGVTGTIFSRRPTFICFEITR